jgi:hypothetical protein
VWSLGVMLYLIVYQKHPLNKKVDGKSYIEIVKMFIDGKVQIEYPPVKGL